MPRRLPSSVLSQSRQRQLAYQYGKSHLVKERRLPAPVMPTFAQKVALSDGSTFTHWTTSPKTTIRLTRDVSNSPLWTLSATAGGRGSTEDDESGRMGRFRSKFGSGDDFESLSDVPTSASA
jgi:hypothetical protein